MAGVLFMFTESDINRLPYRRGPFTAKIALIGEAPGETEEHDDLKRPFIGTSGQLLEGLLKSNGVDPSQVYFSNVLKERPEDKEISKWLKKNTEKTSLYTKILSEELSALPNLQFIVPCGGLALSTICSKPSIDNWRGSIIPATLSGVAGKKCVPIIHPAAILREWLYRPATVLDIQRIAEESKTPEINLPKRNFRIRPTFEEVIEYIHKLKISKELISLDLETLPRPQRIVSIQLCDSPFDSIAIPFQYKDGRDYWPEDQEIIIWRALVDLLENCGKRIIGQNILTFDLFMLEVFGFDINKLLSNVYLDTMEAFGCLQPQLPKGLDFLTSVYTREPYYKSEGKEWGTKQGENEFWMYGCKDVMVVHEMAPQIFKELEEEKLLDFYYERYQGLAHARLKMSRRGLRIDEKKRLQLEKDYMREITIYQCRLNILVGENINVKSGPQMQKLLYDKMHLPKQFSKKGTLCCDENAILALSAKFPSIVFSHTLKIRGMRTLLSNNIRARKDSDGRIRCSFGFAETGRFRSYECPLGSGGNLQNYAPKMRVMVVPDPGYVLLEGDLSQAEARVVAWAGHIEYMVNAFLNGLDVHKATASLVFDLPLEKIGKKSPERQAAKKIVHACLTKDHDVLTPAGWKSIAEVKEGELVMQWKQLPDRSFVTEFTPILKTHAYTHSGFMYSLEGQSVSAFMTPDHRLPICAGAKNPVNVVRAGELYKNYKSPLLPLNGTSLDIPEKNLQVSKAILALSLAIQADGSMDKEGYGKRIVFHFTKDRKKQRLLELLKRLEIPYMDGPCTCHDNGLRITIHQNELQVAEALSLLDYDKTLSWELLNLPLELRKFMLDELLFWDGSTGSGNASYYFTTKKKNALVVQAVAHITGKGTTFHEIQDKRLSSTGEPHKLLYRVAFNNRTYANLTTSIDYKSQLFSGEVYCITVESGFFLIRRNDKISVTGNCNYKVMGPTFTKSYNKDAADMGYPLIDIKTGSAMLATYMARVPELSQNYHAWIEEQLKATKILYNPFGRRMVFHDRIGQDLFRAGYAWYAQSAVADVTNMILACAAKVFDVLLQVHDSVLLQCKASEVKEVIEFMRASNPTFIVGGEKLTIPMEFKVSDVSWYDLTDYKEV
jgi:DNA polymerase-1